MKIILSEFWLNSNISVIYTSGPPSSWLIPYEVHQVHLSRRYDGFIFDTLNAMRLQDNFLGDLSSLLVLCDVKRLLSNLMAFLISSHEASIENSRLVDITE